MTMTIYAQSATATADTHPTLLTHDDDSDNSAARLAPFLLRLHLLRHGETEANAANLILGQGDSPLTPNGLALAALASSSSLVRRRSVPFWRAYCSDLERARRTARIVLGLEDVHGNCGNSDSSAMELVVDSRLRERAKGAREGYAKSISYEKAMELRTNHANGGEVRIPLLETVDEAWERVKGWVDSLVRDSTHDFYSMPEHNKLNAPADVDLTKIYHVFALTHSALIRITIHKMVGDQLPNDYAKTNDGSLSIPNLSCTTIDVRPHFNRAVQEGSWTSSLVRLADVSYLGVTASTHASSHAL
ncbi:hypothetical protein ACHAWX_006645 [Stephanocyclus meneghinianus]